MNLRQLIASVFVLLSSILPIRAETLVTDLSQSEIQITSQFAGSELLLFGAIERHAVEATQTDEIQVQGLDYDIIVVVQSDPTDLVIRKKENVAGIWINNQNVNVSGVPGYYVIGSTRSLDDFLPADKQVELELGLENLTFNSDADPAEVRDYKAALIRNMIDRGLYLENYGNVEVKNQILFRANLTFPSNMPVGNYNAEVYLVRDGNIIMSHSTPLLVDKQGIERLIYNFAHDYPPFYGIMAIIVAISAGLFSGYVARKFS
ncbi:TIGR02186 family protein [Pseudemcibacter aquimaris]|uniref:TIGR02186 family protein n=1 Tax=Pseudemcibacter aquimaris TaxID=2857064 RepID=UPI002011D8D0|nr:TIGR02186 family protein [Pseudemcibacter aquimaris]MCC3862022.1 TIGR02186 family protein [Pseudemcibacter aquimaris]WDU58774.1 TIGR02186 family protein [Pseudemcibacter aquimaris]